MLNENEAQLTKLLAKLKKEDEEREVSRKRKSDQLETLANNQLAAPECPVHLA